MPAEAWVSVAAILFSPVVALGLGMVVQRWQAKRDRRQALFTVLMTSRATRLDLEHVRALNEIDLAFDGKSSKHKEVREARREYLSLLTSEDQGHPAAQERSLTRLVDLLIKMGRVLGYNFDSAYIKEGAYYPTGLGEAWNDNLMIRRGMAKIMRGEASFPIAAVVAPSAPTEPSPQLPPLGTDFGQVNHQQ